MPDMMWALFFFACILGGLWAHRRTVGLLHGWAAAHHLELEHYRKRHVMRGPFTWSSTPYQVVFAVVVRDSTGARSRAFVRVGSAWLGICSNQVEAVWMSAM